MKKGIALGMLVVASFVLLGCQQPQPAVTGEPKEQKTSTTATVTIGEGAGEDTTTSTGTVTILEEQTAVTQETATGTLEILPGEDDTPPTPPAPPVPPVME